MVLLLIILSIILPVFLILYFFTRKKSFLFASLLLIGGLFIVVETMKYTTFMELFEDSIQEESVVEKITITVNGEGSEKQVSKSKIEVTDPSMIDSILTDFTKMKLKEDNNPPFSDSPSYTIQIVSTNKVRKGVFETELVSFEINDHYLHKYKIVSNTDHLKTVKEVIKR